MSNNVAWFEKVSYKEFQRAIEEAFPDVYTFKAIRQMYDDIKLPVRATMGSAGYDFYSPITFSLDDKDKSIKFPTGIKCCIDDGWVLMLFPRSSVGFKYGARLANCVGIIDGDYYNNPDNEGDISVKLCCAQKPMLINAGDRFMQGILLPYGITHDDDAIASRNGGTGSTGK